MSTLDWPKDMSKSSFTVMQRQYNIVNWMADQIYPGQFFLQQKHNTRPTDNSLIYYCKSILTHTSEVKEWLFWRLAFSIFHYFFNRTVKDLAEHINGVRINILIPLKTGDLARTNAVSVNQFVLRHIPFSHCIPQAIIDYHPTLQKMLSYNWIITAYGV